MTQTAAGTADATPDAIERRRPGRAATVSPELIPLLRGQAGGRTPEYAPASPAERAEGDLSQKPGLGVPALRGIVIAILLSIPLWAAVGFGIDWVLLAH